MTHLTQFTTGEVDVQVWKRTDTNEYLTAAQSLLNMEIGTTGLAKKRKGTSLRYNATDYAEMNSRMYDFVDNFNNHYVVVSVNGFFNVFTSAASQVQIITNTGADVVTAYGTNVVAFSDSLTFVQQVAMPYTSAELGELDYTQDNDAIIFSHPDHIPGKLYITAYNGNNPPTFAFDPLAIYPYPSYDFNKINYSGTSVTLSVAMNVLTIAFAGLPDGATYTDDWIGGEIVGSGLSEFQPIGYAIIKTVSQVGHTVTFTADVQLPFQTSGYYVSGSQYSIRQPAWSDDLGWPAKVLFFQNRLWFGNTSSLSNTIFGSKINKPINFDVGTGADTDAIVYTIGQTNSGSILWMNGGKQMEIYCQYYEFACPQDLNTALTPTSFSIRQQSAYGASPDLKPISYINDSYYSNKTGKAIINFHFNGIGLTYVSSNISVASSHLVKTPENRALVRGSDTSQDNFIYFLNNDNTITTFQFAAEVKLAALTPTVFQDDVDIIDICTIDNSMHVLKFYNLTNQFTIEQMVDDSKMDCTFSAAMATTGVVSGLDLLDGYTVQVLYLNQDFGEYLVVGGQITVDNPDEIADTVLIGLLYSNVLTPMYPYYEAGTSPFKKTVQRIYVDYYNSLDFSINGKLVPYQSFPLFNGKPITPQTDTAIISPFSGSNRFDDNGVPIISITQRSPFDLQILGISYQLDAAVL
jgi:hypothetical protein